MNRIAIGIQRQAGQLDDLETNWLRPLQLGRIPAAARIWLALGNNVQFVLKDIVYEIHE